MLLRVLIGRYTTRTHKDPLKFAFPLKSEAGSLSGSLLVIKVKVFNLFRISNKAPNKDPPSLLRGNVNLGGSLWVLVVYLLVKTRSRIERC